VGPAQVHRSTSPIPDESPRDSAAPREARGPLPSARPLTRFSGCAAESADAIAGDQIAIVDADLVRGSGAAGAFAGDQAEPVDVVLVSGPVVADAIAGAARTAPISAASASGRDRDTVLHLSGSGCGQLRESGTVIAAAAGWRGACRLGPRMAVCTRRDRPRDSARLRGGACRVCRARAAPRGEGT